MDNLKLMSIFFSLLRGWYHYLMDGSLLINMLACDLPLKCIQQKFFIFRKNKKYSNIQERRQGFLITFLALNLRELVSWTQNQQ